MQKVALNRIMYFDGFESECSDDLSAKIVQDCLDHAFDSRNQLLQKIPCFTSRYLEIGALIFQEWMNSIGPVHDLLRIKLTQHFEFQVFIKEFTQFIKENTQKQT